MQPDCFTTLAGLATATSRIRLGTLVCCVYYRTPTLLARQAADVDRISRGRLVLGLGIGWIEQELADQGLPLPPLRDRRRALDETVATVRRIWAEGPAPRSIRTGGAIALLLIAAAEVNLPVPEGGPVAVFLGTTVLAAIRRLVARLPQPQPGRAPDAEVGGTRAAMPISYQERLGAI